jgi:hypothetical protein
MLDLAARSGLRRIDAFDTPRREILVAGIHRGEPPAVTSEKHDLRTRFAEMTPGRGKFENLGEIVDAEADWLVVIDDDVVLPPRFLDRFIAICEDLGFDLAQPAQSLASHAAWPVVRRRPFLRARETRFVEIGPVTAFSRRAAGELLPFPPLRYGWGLDLHWAAVAAERGWKLGIVDAVPVRHESAPVATGYSPEAAIEEAQKFLADRPYLPSSEAGDVLAVYR